MSAYNYVWYGDDDNELAGAAGKARRLADEAALIEARNRLIAAQAQSGQLPQNPPILSPGSNLPAPASSATPALPNGSAPASPGLLDSFTGVFDGLPSWAPIAAIALGAWFLLKRR